MKVNEGKPQATPRTWGRLISLVLLTGLMSPFSSGYLLAGEDAPANAATDITVYKTPYCGCCTKWVDHLKANGFNVDVKTVEKTDSIRANLGIPDKLASCHTAVVGKYWVEGHVPADLIQMLLQDQPANIKGLSAPGMPQGAPGMDIPNSPPYSIYSLDDNGQIEVYATRKGDAAN